MRHPSSLSFRRYWCMVLTLFLSTTSAIDASAREARHHSSHSPRASLAAINEIMQRAVAEGNIPGGVVVVGHRGKIVYRKAFGWRSLEPAKEEMTVDTIFDIASLTKCVATTTSIMELEQQGKLRLNDPVSLYLPDFGQNGKANITIRELLTHYSGLAPDLDLKTTWQGRDTAYRMVMQEKPIYPPGSRFLYSDINFETLGFIVESISGTSLKDFSQENIFAPLRMLHTTFTPPEEWLSRIAPTEYSEQNHILRGVVHDPTARRMGGVAGHAGLFSTADDLARFAQSLLTGSRILNRATIEKMSTPQQPPNGLSLRGLGWDIDSPYSTNRGELLPVGSFGHTGFTGTSLWIDPITNTYIIILTNVVHPHVGKSVVSLRSRVSNAVVDALQLNPSEEAKHRLVRITGYNETMTASRLLSERNGEVQMGIDVLESQGFSALHPNKNHPVRVGLVTNQTGVDSQGRRTIDALAATPGIQLKTIFSPEHGVAGILDTTDIGNTRDAATGVPVLSVYGDSDAKRRPSPESLNGLDAIVYDIQDVGVRFYTYESTLGYFLEAAAKADKEIIVLDRVNPIGGVLVQGPVADAGRESFVDYGQTPIRHGMTTGELAKMFNVERGINAKLTIVPMQGWIRGDWFDSTGRVWISPSPNMRNLTQAILYPGLGMIEGTNISVGRGTDTPFELVGAPWVNAAEFAHYLNGRGLSGVRFVAVNFTPAASVYAHQSCGGVNVLVMDRNALDAPALGLEIAAALRALYPSHYDFNKLDWLMVNQASMNALAAGEDPRRIAADWLDPLKQFEDIRAKYLIY